MRVYFYNRKDIAVFRDGKRLDIKYKEGKEFVDLDVAEGDEYCLEFLRKSEFSRPMWWLYAALFWIVGIMGIFTPRFSKNTHSLNCKLTGIAKGKDIKINFPTIKYRKAVGVAVELIKGEDEILEGAEYIDDKIAKKRRKIYNVISALMRLAVIICIVIIIIKKVIG